MARTNFPLLARLPRFEELSNELILDRFLDYTSEKKLELYPAQEEAILALFEGQNVILNTPTGSGKSLVATAMHFHSLALGRRSVYTCPIKALVNEKFLHLCKEFGPEQVGMMTGDGAVNRDAPILCCTAEILSQIALREGEWAKVDDVVMDEFHYYSDRERGVAWQVPLLTMHRTRFLLMSATLGDMDFFSRELERLNGKQTAVVTRAERPVPLSYEYSEKPLHETVKELIDSSAAPVYLVNFTQREAAEEAQNLMSVDFLSKDQKREIAERLTGVRFSSPYGKEMQKYLKHGVGLHHAGLLPKYRILVEKLAQDGLLKVISGTDTLGVGVNIPIRTVLFTKLCKFDGEKTTILTNRDFHQIAGRAGRKGFDERGRVVAQAPEHVIENLRLEAKAKADPKKAKKLVKVKPPDRGYVHFDKSTFDRLVSGAPEPLQSRFSVSHGMLLNVLSRHNEDGCESLRRLIASSHESDPHKKKHRRFAWQLFRALLDRKIVEIEPKGSVRSVRVNVSLQEDFSLNQTLALWLIDTLALLDLQSETYALDVLTLVEAILESPDLILRKQTDRLKTEKMRELKEAGMEYEERIEELEKIEHPKPLRDFVYSTFNAFSDAHPWVGSENIRPKSIAREMYETFQSFAEYVREYELQKAEGLLLRYLSDVYRALSQTVPAQFKTDEVDSIVEYFGSIVRSIDSSLVDEWEKLKDPKRELGTIRESAYGEREKTEAPSRDVFSDPKAVRIRVLNEVFRLIRTLATGDFDETLLILSEWFDGVPQDAEGTPWTVQRLQERAQAYLESGHRGLRTDPGARMSSGTRIQVSDQMWSISQTLYDPDDHNDWQVNVLLDLQASRERERLVLQLILIGEISALALE
jgi:superfamily II RNA helicase